MKKAMIFAAGLGTRLKPFTLNAPKAMAPVNGKPLLQRNIEYLKTFGIEEIVVNVHHFADQIISFLEENDFGVKTIISDETDEVLETGGGLLKARPLLEDADDILIMNVDILTDIDISELIKQHNENDALATLAVSNRESSRGLLFDQNLQLCGWHNKKTNEEKIVHKKEVLVDFAFSGIQVLSSNIFPLINQRGPDGLLRRKFSIIDTYLDLAKTQKILAFDHSGNILMDVGNPERLKKAEEVFQ
jgi:NDP-sugar pyrophosphorylase family protein